MSFQVALLSVFFSCMTVLSFADLPDNTLYELDYNEYPKGNYTVVVNTFSKTLVKEIEVK